MGHSLDDVMKMLFRLSDLVLCFIYPDLEALEFL